MGQQTSMKSFVCKGTCFWLNYLKASGKVWKFGMSRATKKNCLTQSFGISVKFGMIFMLLEQTGVKLHIFLFPSHL